MSRRELPAATMRRPVRKTRRRGALETGEAVVLGGVFTFLLGGYWDVAWHIERGRETFWSPPHLLLYLGVLLVIGIAAYALLRAWRARRRPPPGPLIAGFGAALSLASAPIDDTWHRLYGLDVTILSPPHVMLIAGMAIAAFGSLAGFALHANRADPERLAALWRSTSTRWRARGYEGGIVLAAGALLALVLGVLGEYDFDVARYPVYWHPILLCTLAPFVLALGARALGRVGGATLVAAAYTGVRAATHVELLLLARSRPEVPLVLVAAVAMDLVLWGFTKPSSTFNVQGSKWLARRVSPRRWAPLAASVAFAAVLLLVEWPYTAAWNGVVWRPEVLRAAAAPAVLGAAVMALAGWWLGGILRPLTAASSPPAQRPPEAVRRGQVAGTPAPRWNGWYRRPGIAILAAALALALIGVVPAARRHGAPAVLGTGFLPNTESLGYLQFSPALPVVGQPLVLRVVLDDPSLVGRAVAIPYETVRAGDVARGVMRTTGEAGVYQVTITPTEAGERWVSIFVANEEGRVAATATMMVYRPGEETGQTPLPSRPLIVRPEPGPDLSLPGWLTPAVWLGIAVLIAAELAATAWVLRGAGRPVVVPVPVVAPNGPAPARGRAARAPLPARRRGVAPAPPP